MAATLSRYAVYLALPVAGLVGGTILDRVWFFRRGTSRHMLYAWLQHKLKTASARGLVVYPEGTRRLSHQPIMLKTGMLTFAYEHKLPIQIILTRNKEQVFCEKTYSAQRHVTLYTYYDQVIMPHDFADVDAFLQHVQAQWNHAWEQHLQEPTFAVPFVPTNKQITDTKSNQDLCYIRTWMLFLSGLLVWASVHMFG